MYPAVLALHSLLRWAVLIVGVIACVRAISGSRSRRPWGPADERAGRWFVSTLDLQFLLGVLLYAFLSPMTSVAFADVGAAMRDGVLRFWAVEHLIGMVVALALAHIGRVRVRRAADDRARHRTAAIFFSLALIAIVMTIPWPGTTAGRPLLPGF
jgi:hypothetical protein